MRNKIQENKKEYLTIVDNGMKSLCSLLTLVVFCPEWRIHDHCVKLVGKSFCLQRAQVTLDQIYVENLKFLCISPEYLQCVVVNVEADTETGEKTAGDLEIKLNEMCKLGTKQRCKDGQMLSHPASSIAAPMLRTPQPHPRSATTFPSMSPNVLWIV